MKTATKVSQLVLLGSGALLLVLGLIIWTGHGGQLIGIHALLGFLLVLSLWAIAAIAARTGVSIGLVALAVAWGLAAPILGGVQDRLVAGGWHWTIQVLHLVVSMGVIAVGRLLVIRIRRNEAAAGLSRRRPIPPAQSTARTRPMSESATTGRVRGTGPAYGRDREEGMGHRVGPGHSCRPLRTVRSHWRADRCSRT